MKRTFITKVSICVDIADFFNFLSANNALAQYLNALHKNRADDPQISKFFLESAPPENWLSGAFSWVTTPQGHEYWKELSNKWRAVLYDDLDPSEVTIKASGK